MGVCVFGDELTWQQSRAEQETVGRICRESQNNLKTRVDAFEMLCEWIKSDGEYFVASDELLKTMESRPQFFFEQMVNRPDSFQRWIGLIQASSFRSPYLYTNVPNMEKRRLHLVAMLGSFTANNAAEEALKQKVLVCLESFKASQVN